MGALKGVPKLVASDQKNGRLSASIHSPHAARIGYHKSVVIENRYHKYHNVVISVVLYVTKQYELNKLIYDL